MAADSSALAAFLAAFLAEASLSLGFCHIFEDTAMRKNDAFGIFVELDYLEVEFLINLSLSSVFLNEMFGSRETFYSVRQCDNRAFFEHFDNRSLMDRTYCKHGLEYVPGIFFELFVSEAETTIFFVDFENLNFDIGTDLSKLRGVFDFLCPRKVGDVDKTFYAFFDFYEYAEVGEVTNFGLMTRCLLYTSPSPRD